MVRRALEVESNSVLAATIALVVFIGIMHPDFLAWGQLKEVVQNATYVGIIAAGMAFLLSMRALISPEHWLKGYLAIKLMADAKLEDKPLPEGVWNSGALTVNADNIDEILTRQESAETRSEYFKEEVDKQLANPEQYLG